MFKPKVTLGNYWVEAFCCCFFEHEGFEALSFPLEGFSPLESCDSVWKTGWSVSILMRNSWDSSFGIPILFYHRIGVQERTLPITKGMVMIASPNSLSIFLSSHAVKVRLHLTRFPQKFYPNTSSLLLLNSTFILRKF